MQYSISKWYWSVGNKVDTVVFSAPAAAYVGLNDPDYIAFLADGNVPTPILCDGELAQILIFSGYPLLAQAAGITSLGNVGSGMSVVDAVKLLSAWGVSAISAGNNALDSTYPTDQATQANITAEAVYIGVTGNFTNGTGTRNWPDVGGALHLFSTAEFISFAEAVGGYIDAINVWALGDVTLNPPSNEVAIV